MKKLFGILVLVMVLMVTSVTASFAGWVNGYYRSDGTYVHGYYRSDRNSTVRDNWSYKGNYNPYTGEEGHNYYRHNPTSEYWDGTYDYDFYK